MANQGFVRPSTCTPLAIAEICMSMCSRSWWACMHHMIDNTCGIHGVLLLAAALKCTAAIVWFIQMTQQGKGNPEGIFKEPWHGHHHLWDCHVTHFLQVASLLMHMCNCLHWVHSMTTHKHSPSEKTPTSWSDQRLSAASNAERLSLSANACSEIQCASSFACQFCKTRRAVISPAVLACFKTQRLSCCNN